jgi:glutathione synthase/RimK-type ligase-like ATP-grasp enzyme
MSVAPTLFSCWPGPAEGGVAIRRRDDLALALSDQFPHPRFRYDDGGIVDGQHGPKETVSIVGYDNGLVGYLHGVRQPFLQAHLRIDAQREGKANASDAVFRRILNKPDIAGYVGAPTSIIERILYWTAQFQTASGDLMFEPPRLLWRSAAEPTQCVVAIPTVDRTTATLVLEAVVRAFNGAQIGPAQPHLSHASNETELSNLVSRRRKSAISPLLRSFICAARSCDIPWRQMGSTNVYQFGQGAKSRWLDGTFSDLTSGLGAQMARNKVATASVLRQIGIPTPPQFVVRNEQMAVQAAQMLGFPVVVKPFDLDGGAGVYVSLQNPDEVLSAFAKARAVSERLIVERHVSGRDYRLCVFNDRLLWAYERVPGGVVGDGQRTVRQLVDDLNAERARDPGASLKPLILDDDTRRFLTGEGLDEQAVPEDGRYVRLKGAGNINLGGTPVPVLHAVHPDNAELAKRAARALRLDIAGIDLITPDIARSWKDTGGHVCEVNARPDFSGSVPQPIFLDMLRELVGGDGRIPVALIVGASLGEAACALLERTFAMGGRQLCIAADDLMRRGLQRHAAATPGAYTHAEALLAERATDALIVTTSDQSFLRTGLPFARCDVLAFAGANAGAPEDDATDFQVFSRSISPHGSGALILNADDPQCRTLDLEGWVGRTWFYAEGGLMAAGDAQRGPYAWVNIDEAEIRLQLSKDGAPIIRFPLGRLRHEINRRDVLLAASVALAMGCPPAHLEAAMSDLPAAPQ